MRKVGILGTGGMGKVHARQYAKMRGVELHFYEEEPSKAAAYAADFDAAPAKSAEALIELADVVDVCLPTHLHLEYASKALQAGKPTFCEKPMCRTSEECLQLLELSQKTGTPLMPAQVVRFFPEFRKANTLVKDGILGRPGAIRTRRGGRFPKGSKDWFSRFEQSGGVVMDLMIHDFDWIRWTFGAVRRVFAQSLTDRRLHELDYALVTLTLDSGALAHVEGTWADPGGFRVTFEVSGSEGFMEYDSKLFPTLRTNTEGGSSAESPMAPHDDPYFAEIDAFLRAVDAGGKPPVSPEDGLRAVQICEAAIASASSGRSVEMPQ